MSADPPQPPEPFRLDLPVTGVEGVDWVISYYVDLDPEPGFRDYRGGKKVNNEHRGTDFSVPNFRWMDDKEKEKVSRVVAAADGRITALHDGELDRNVAQNVDQAVLSCTRRWNFVEITHLNGLRSIYGHLKKGSVEVSVGQQVNTGQKLGVIGSSGCSSAPHLHLELRSESGEVIDPFFEKLWRDPPHYDRPLTLMDYILQDGPVTGIDNMRDPPQANIDSIFVGSTLGVGLWAAGADIGDELRVVLSSGNNRIEYDRVVTFQEEYPQSYWYWDFNVTDHTGIWRMQVYIKGVIPNLRIDFSLLIELVMA